MSDNVKGLVNIVVNQHFKFEYNDIDDKKASARKQTMMLSPNYLMFVIENGIMMVMRNDSCF